MERYCISKEYTIKEAIESIESFHNRVVIVVDESERVLGVLSQGDVIRALMSGKSLYTQVKNVIRPNFFYQNSKNMVEAYHLFKKYKITLLPIVDSDFRLVDIISIDDIYNYMEEK